MLKSNCKAVKTAIREFIIDYLRNGTDFENDDDFGLVRNYYEELMRNLHGDKWHPTDMDKVMYHLDCGGWECGTYARRMLLKDWLRETDDEAFRFTDTKVDEQFKYLVAREILAMAHA